MSATPHDPNTPAPDEITQRELQRLVRMNDTLQKRLDGAYDINPKVIKMIGEIACTILTVGSHHGDVTDPAIFLNEARRLHAINEKLESLSDVGGIWVTAIIDNAGLISSLLDEYPMMETRIQCLKEAAAAAQANHGKE